MMFPQASVAGSNSSQYQNSYVNASSHSPLASISTPKPLTGLSSAPSVKDTTQVEHCKVFIAQQTTYGDCL